MIIILSSRPVVFFFRHEIAEKREKVSSQSKHTWYEKNHLSKFILEEKFNKQKSARILIFSLLLILKLKE